MSKLQETIWPESKARAIVYIKLLKGVVHQWGVGLGCHVKFTDDENALYTHMNYHKSSLVDSNVAMFL